MSYVKGELDIELLQLQAGAEQEQMMQDKSPEYREGFLAGCQFIINYAKSLYQVCDKLAKEKNPAVYGGWHICPGTLDKPHRQAIVLNGKLCPICGRD